MTAPEHLISEPHDDCGLETFTCGNPALDAWLRESALRAHKAGSARVWLLWRIHDGGGPLGYYAICPTEVRRDEFPWSSRVRGAVSTVPGFMLAKLAVALDEQGRGLGRDLLVDALEHICEASELAGGRIVVVDPIDDRAASFYSKHGFQTVDGHTRMYMLVQDARISLGLD
ncbi:N-acetyltransferase GCN5 [Actinomycetota bacterium]|nr:N-acetyltransferase GCN5 [Actinomycetota bacterium]